MWAGVVRSHHHDPKPADHQFSLQEELQIENIFQQKNWKRYDWNHVSKFFQPWSPAHQTKELNLFENSIWKT